MFGDISKAKMIYIACGYTDMRKSIDGFAAIVQQNFHLNPFQNSLFLFCGRRRDRLKALYWEGMDLFFSISVWKTVVFNGQRHLKLSGNSLFRNYAGSWRDCPLTSLKPLKNWISPLASNTQKS
jgi:hypothetical protein